jgi:hypothetical protein
MHLHPEDLRAPRHRLTDPAHAENAQPLAADAPAHEGRGRPAGPVALLHDGHALGQTPRTLSISAITMSAVSSVITPGVFDTRMPRWRAVETSIWSTPAP